MLKLVNIKKDYVTKGVPTVHALKGLTVNFRRNEFVAILGASGCGKTTLLNIIGGLDRYTSGDLIIEGKSTKKYTDRDWDTYRNHSIGFVFQSYNLIGHQTVLGNVELALTISGVSKEERKQRAIAALETVGLKGMEKKKPNQLSGGQMQRVAIARALVNDPEILLADEPTGALDSQTSIQIMDLLKEVASDRLVIMVTHNPDLAEKYANRIVTMKDGLITGDANPYEGESKEELKAYKDNTVSVNKGKKAKTSMSFFTATGLSFFNLLSKLKRTILITIAGSIGIIGVSSVLAVSNGVNNYVHHMQDDMLSSYPLQISEQSVDYSSLMSGLASMNDKEISQFDLRTEVGLDSMINYLMDKYRDFTSVKTNDINPDLIDFIYGLPKEQISSISQDFGLDLTNNVFSNWQRDENSEKKYMSLNGLTQMYIAELRTVEGFAEYAMFVDLFTDFMKQIPGDQEYVLSQYDLVGENSKYPSNANEIVLVVDDNQTLTDLIYAQMGFYNENEFLNIARKAIKSQEVRENEKMTDAEKEAALAELDAKYVYPEKYSIDDIIGKELKYYKHDDIWSYREINKKTTTFSLNVPTIGNLDFELSYNSNYEEKGILLLEGTMTYNDNIVLDISCDRTDDIPLDPTNPFLGSWDFSFGEYSMKLVFTDTTVTMMMGAYPVAANTYTTPELTKTSGFMYDAEADAGKGETIKIAGILKKKKGVSFGCLDRGVYYTSAMTQKMMADSVNSQIVTDSNYGIKKYIGSPKELDKTYSAYVTYTYTSFKKGDSDPQYDIPGYARALNTDFNSSLSSMFSITGSNNFDIDKAYLRSLCGLATKYNESGTGYVFEEVPQSISIYPKDFNNKKKVVKYLNRWNNDGELTIPNGKVLAKDDRQELTITDTIEIIVNLINTLITTITIALVAFTSLSLVVSCFMIAVITYISTMERVKEIGVIRSLGGRKKDVSRLFIAECLIIGLASGVFGVLITYGLSLIFNLSIMQFGVGNIAALPITTALIMIGVSIVLNVLSGLIPAMRASNQDPVVALRTE